MGINHVLLMQVLRGSDNSGVVQGIVRWTVRCTFRIQNQNVLVFTSKCAMQHKQRHKYTHKCPNKKIDIRRQRRLRGDLNGLRVKQSPGKLSVVTKGGNLATWSKGFSFGVLKPRCQVSVLVWFHGC